MDEKKNERGNFFFEEMKMAGKKNDRKKWIFLKTNEEKSDIKKWIFLKNK